MITITRNKFLKSIRVFTHLTRHCIPKNRYSILTLLIYIKVLLFWGLLQFDQGEKCFGEHSESGGTQGA